MKRSQISIFLVLGIVLIVMLASFILINFNIADLEIEQDTAINMEFVNDPIFLYVTECLNSISYDAIIEIGEHGGYADIERYGLNVNPNDPLNSEAVALSLTGSSDASSSLFAIPYFFHMVSPTGCAVGCEFLISIPELYKTSGVRSIEGELDYFVDAHLERCIDDFRTFRQTGYDITILDKPKVDSRVNINSISFMLYYPIQISQGGNVYTIDRYYYEHDINFGNILEMAIDVTYTQAEYRFLEYQVLDMLSAYSGLDNVLPPLADSTFNFGDPGQIWVKSDVKNSMQDILMKYVNALRVYGSNNYVDLGDDEFSARYLDHQMRVVLSRDYDLDIFFNYLSLWPIYFDMNCEGEICRPESFSTSLLPFIGTQRYEFFYSVSHPVLVKIHDPTAFNGEGYNFYFFLESNIFNNDIIWPGGFGAFESPTSGSSLMCNENQKTSGVHTMEIIDGITGELVEDVLLMFNCATESCTMDPITNGTFESSLPVCVGGRLILQKEGYMTKSVYVEPRLDEDDNIGEVVFEPLRNVEININKIKILKDLDINNWTQQGQGGLRANQEATIILTSVNNPEFIQLVTIDGNDKGTARLVPGEYHVQVFLLDKNTIIIPEDERQETALGGIIRNRYTMPEVIFNESNPWQLGGLDGNYRLNRVNEGDTVTISVIALEMGEVLEENRKIEDIEVLSFLEDYMERYNHLLGFR
ncbi:MAG: hypothetical protein ACMXYG_05245 [Candidatus Woesearchaeota archaeon]